MAYSNTVSTIDDLMKPEIEAFIPDESQYQIFATPLKPPSAFRKAHQDNLAEFFKFEELQEHLEEAPKIVLKLMPNYRSQEDFAKIKNEIDKSIHQFILISLSMSETSEKPIFLKDLFGITDDSLMWIYELGVELVKKNNYSDGYILFVFLTTLAPYVEGFWISQGISLQALNRHEDAIETFKNAKILKPNDPIPSAYLIESYLNLMQKNEAEIELNSLKNLVKTLESEEKNHWENKIKEIML